VIVPNPKYRPNPERAIFVQNHIDSSLYYDVARQIVSLQHKSREPITVYIDSLGGNTHYLDAIFNLLKSKTQTPENLCHIITVAVDHAASAAADLLSFGDYALAYPHSRILFHGVRTQHDEITTETSAFLTQQLRFSNERSAEQLANKIERRFLFRFVTTRRYFDEIRTQNQNPHLGDLDCFLIYISRNLSDTAKEILKLAHDRRIDYNVLFFKAFKKPSKQSSKNALKEEATQLKAIIDLEVEKNKSNPNWRFSQQGIHQLTQDFLLLKEFTKILSNPKLGEWIAQLGKFLLTDDQLQEVEMLKTDKDKYRRINEMVFPILEPVWSFLVALCNVLQRGDNDFLTAIDAYWLGLIDEIIGDETLVYYRYIEENVADVKP
jgi:ATP-dependent protease ClpP protease subunit